MAAKKKQIQYKKITVDQIFPCLLRGFRISADVCQHRKELHRRGCCCQQVAIKDDGYYLAA
jgi:hypothetical protein